MANNRRCDIVELSNAELTALIQPVWAGERVESAQLLSGGVINTNYKVAVSGSDTPYVIRVYARDPQAGEREAAIGDLIAGTVPVPRTLYWSAALPPEIPPRETLPPETLPPETREIAERVTSYAVVEWRPGVVLQAVLDNGTALADGIEDAFEDAGRVLAEISKYKFDRSGFFSAKLEIAEAFGDDPTAYMRACLGKPEVRERLGADLFAATCVFVENNRERLAADGAEPASLVHGDYNPRNLLVSRSDSHADHGKWQVSAVLDWEFAHAGTVLFDIGNMLRNRQKYARLEASFIKGFTESGGELHPDWQALSRFIDLNNLLEFLTGEDRSWLYAEVLAAISATITVTRE